MVRVKDGRQQRVGREVRQRAQVGADLVPDPRNLVTGRTNPCKDLLAPLRIAVQFVTDAKAFNTPWRGPIELVPKIVRAR